MKTKAGKLEETQETITESDDMTIVGKDNLVCMC